MHETSERVVRHVLRIVRSDDNCELQATMTRTVQAVPLEAMAMIQINIGDHSGSEHNIPFLPIPEKWRNMTRWARQHATKVAHHNPAANRYFRSLPRGRSFTSLIGDSNIWLNYFNDPNAYGFTFANYNIWLSDSAFLGGRWMLLATIVHELAHVNGAIGGAAVCSNYSTPCHAAERAVLECGLGSRSERSGRDDRRTPYMPGLAG